MTNDLLPKALVVDISFDSKNPSLDENLTPLGMGMFWQSLLENRYNWIRSWDFLLNHRSVRNS